MVKKSLKFITLALILSVSAVIVSAGGTVSSRSITFEVPFDFQVGNDKYEKGTYKVTRENQNIILISSLDGSDAKVILAGNSGDGLSSFAQSNITFYKYGERYFLRKINSPTVSAYVRVSKDEKAVLKEGYKKLAKVTIKASR